MVKCSNKDLLSSWNFQAIVFSFKIPAVLEIELKTSARIRIQHDMENMLILKL